MRAETRELLENASVSREMRETWHVCNLAPSALASSVSRIFICYPWQLCTRELVHQASIHLVALTVKNIQEESIFHIG